MKSFFVTDLHGSLEKYNKLFNQIEKEKPQFLFIGGDLGGHLRKKANPELDFYEDFLLPRFDQLKKTLADEYPKVFILMGNDDPKSDEHYLIDGEKKKLWIYIHSKIYEVSNYKIAGYSYNPPSPFQLKDWEKYDVSRYVDPGCISPEEGFRTIELEENHIKYSTIKDDLGKQFNTQDLSNYIMLFHTPPYKTNLDRAALDNKKVDHAPVDVHVGSIALKKFVEVKQPLLTLHGHIHESTSITGKWRDQIGNTICFNGAHNGKELSLIKFNIKNPANAERILI